MHSVTYKKVLKIRGKFRSCIDKGEKTPGITHLISHKTSVVRNDRPDMWK